MGMLTAFIKKSWSEILRISESNIQPDDSFAELGGSALNLYQFLYQLESYIDKKINISVFIDNTTINEIVMYLMEQNGV